MNQTAFIRMLTSENKGNDLAHVVEKLRHGQATEGNVFFVEPESFRQVPGAPFCYWVSERLRRMFKDLPSFEGDGRTVKVGLQTGDDFRFVRVWWEVPAERILDAMSAPDWRDDFNAFQSWCRKRTFGGKRWAPFAKGGEYSPYYSDIHLLVDWDRDGEDIRHFASATIRSEELHFRPGLTWSDRTNKDFGPRPMPAGTITSIKGSGGFTQYDALWGMLGLMCSRFFISMMDLIVGSTTLAKSYQVGTIGRVPTLHAALLDVEIAGAAKKCHDLRRERMTLRETDRIFSGVLMDRLRRECLKGLAETILSEDIVSAQETRHNQQQIDDKVFGLYGIGDQDRVSLEQSVLGKSAVTESSDDDETAVSDAEDSAVCESEHVSEELVHSALSIGVGCACGRWDIRFATVGCQLRELPDPFDPLPVCSPAMLQGRDGLPAKPADVPLEYPLRISWDGILVDDPEHEDDVVRRLRDVLEVIWKNRAEAIEKEACDILGVRELRDYFRKPGNGGFWMYHIKRYSKSKRKAPIYWYLRSAKGNYGLWLYYHRLDKDLLFKVLLNYVEPKVRLDEDRLNALRAQREQAVGTGKGVKQIERDLDRQDQFISELRDFKDRLRRAADLHLMPDLNDGVVLNIAALWELVPWKEAQEYWEDLLAGKYEWSGIGKQLREKGLVK